MRLYRGKAQTADMTWVLWGSVAGLNGDYWSLLRNTSLDLVI
jgi:hypothetical protein